MFCARCWSGVGPHDRACTHCHFDLTRPGSVRLTDPRRVPRDINGTPLLPAGAAEPVAPPPPPVVPGVVTGQAPAFDAPMAAQPVVLPAADVPPPPPAQTSTGPGWWHGVKGRLSASSDRAAAAHQQRQQPGTGQQPPVAMPPAAEEELHTVLRVPEEDLKTTFRSPVADAFHADEHDLDRTVLRRPTETDTDATVLRKPVEVDTDATVLRKPAEVDTDATALRSPAETDPDPTVLRKPAPAPASKPGGRDLDRAGFHKAVPPAPPSQRATTANPAAASVGQQPAPAVPKQSRRVRPFDPDRTRRRPRSQPTPSEERIDRTARAPERAPGELNLWDDYGIADSPTGFQIDPTASRSQQISQVLGASAMPTAKVAGFVAVVAGTMIVLALLVGLLLNMDSRIVPTGPGAPSAAPANGTPSMAPGAQQCSDSVWSGEQTSCALAIELAAQVPLNMTAPTTVSVRSASSGSTVQLQCTPGPGITCQGLGEHSSVLIWLVN